MIRKINTLIGITAIKLAFPPMILAQEECPPGSDICIPRPTGFNITDIGRVISAGFGLLLIVAGLLAFIYLLLGGIQWITSGGDKAGLETARNKIIHAVVGLIVVFSAWAITILLQNFLGVTILGGFTIPKPF